MTKPALATLLCTASLLMAAPALAGSWNNYNANYGKGASFSKGTMTRNGSGASIRYTAGGTRSLTVKGPASTRRLTRMGTPRGKRTLRINGSVEITGRNTAQLLGSHWSTDVTTSFFKSHGAKVLSTGYLNEQVKVIRFRAPKESLLSRLGGIVQRVNRPTLQGREKSAASKKTSGNPLYTSPSSNSEHSARSLQPGYKDGNTTTRSGYLGEHGYSGHWGHGRYRVR